MMLELKLIMATSERYGYLSKDRKPMTLSYLASKTRSTIDELQSLLTQLVSGNFIKATEDSVYYDPEMVEQERLRQVRVKAGSKGGNPKLKAASVKTKDTKKKVNQGLTMVVNQNGHDMKDDDVVVLWFETLWAKYPRRLGRKQAFRHFQASVKTEDEVAICQKALENYIRHAQTLEEKYIQHGSTWFNNWRDWVDFAAAGNGKPRDAEIKKRKMDEWKKAGLSICHGSKIFIDDSGVKRCEACIKEQL